MGILDAAGIIPRSNHGTDGPDRGVLHLKRVKIAARVKNYAKFIKEALMVVKTEAAGQNPHKHTQKTSNSMQRGRAATWDRLSTRIMLYRG